MARFRKNFHLAKEIDSFKCDRLIENYPAHFNTPKYLTFIRHMLDEGWSVKLYEVDRSKYVFVYREDFLFKIRFSNHKPIYGKEVTRDCDFYVGISHKQVSTTDQIIQKIKKIYARKR